MRLALPVASALGRSGVRAMGARRWVKTWSGNLTQEEFMAKDSCILVDRSDNVVGSGSKKECHVFDRDQPAGVLHRAFSVFLFNDKDELLLQKRALHKITFPGVWTNTCCSHPLFGYDPDEVDRPEDVESGAVPGVKHAAIRKLEHELGIDASEVPFDGFRFLTRLHYCAADPSSEGSDAQWGEHELDYILLIRARVQVRPNPDEVDEFKYVGPQELRSMMRDERLLWSPWFRIIERNFLHDWWGDLDGALNTSRYRDQVIHKLEC